MTERRAFIEMASLLPLIFAAALAASYAVGIFLGWV
jgi:hypothetical protein